MKRFILFALLILQFSCTNRFLRPSPPPKNLKKAERNYDHVQNLAQRSHEIDNDESIQNLKKDIQKYKTQLNNALLAGQKLGRFYYLLGLKYLDYQMYALALEQFEQALHYYPQKSNLYYYAGVSSGWVADSLADKSLRNSMIEKTRFYLEKGVQLDPNSRDTLFALAVFYAYKDNNAQLAWDTLQSYYRLQNADITSLFLEAYIAVLMGDTDKAIGLYQTIAQNTQDTQEKETALAHLQKLTKS
jgi:tetratricopeptide (TPR) repeat protein